MKRGWIPLAVGGLVLVSSLGCGSEANSETAGTTASLGCDEGSLDAGVTHIDLQYDGAARSYELYLPPAYDGFTPLPVVLSFHGFTSSGLGQQQSSGMDATAEREGFVVVYPNGLDNSWNAGICCGRSADRDIDDVGFTRAVIEDLGATVRDCDGGVTVTLCAIEGAGHCWPGQPCPDRLGSILGDPTFDIDANEAMWELFSRSRLGPR